MRRESEEVRMKKLAKSEIKDLLKHWAGQYRVLAPTLAAGGDCLLDFFDESTFTLDYGKTPMPPKSACLPQSEAIFAVDKGEYREVITATKTILFGIRSCDMMGIRQSASFMTRDRRDPYFGAKRDDLVAVVMACPGPQNETCFCTTMQSGPFSRRGFDLQFYDAGEFFIIETGSAKGEAALSSFPLAELDGDLAGEKVEAFRQRSLGAIARMDVVPEAMNRLKDHTADEGVWERFGLKCIQCGGCTFVCPTCTCFNVCDRPVSPGQGVRERTWDACLFGGFTREASGHNPRSTQALRLKRRHEHKLLDYQGTDIQDGLCGCTGCGRCSDFCPVHIGTLEVARAIAAADSQVKD
jgi:sulfhydrogenase subunit beta (sulfur reductase)